jgi:pilus assembly protein Flp/PilA
MGRPHPTHAYHTHSHHRKPLYCFAERRAHADRAPIPEFADAAGVFLLPVALGNFEEVEGGIIGTDDEVIARLIELATHLREEVNRVLCELKSHLVRLAQDEEGASLVEYILLVALIAVVCIVAVAFLGRAAKAKFSTTATTINAAP